MKASELLLQSAEPFDKACLLVKELEAKIEAMTPVVEAAVGYIQAKTSYGLSADIEVVMNATRTALHKAVREYQKGNE